MTPLSPAQAALVRTLAFHAAWGYPPTAAEAVMQADIGSRLTNNITADQVWSELETLKQAGLIKEKGGRITLSSQEKVFAQHIERQFFVSRKRAAARRAARNLARLGGVRFVALGNTTALSHARDEGDLDLFVVTREGALVQSRILSTVWYKLLGRRPGDTRGERDAVCLSFFIDDSALNLIPLQLPTPLLPKERGRGEVEPIRGEVGPWGRGEVELDDPYFRYWFMSLLPLYDDGVMKDLWDSNSSLRARHPLARPWIIAPDLRIHRPKLRLPLISEGMASRFQNKTLSQPIRDRMNLDTTVVVNEHVLKFHVDDGRARFRSEYQTICVSYGVVA